MKTSFFKKLATVLFLGLTVLTLGACQSANKDDAKIYVSKDASVANIFVNEKDGKRYATLSIGVENNTIYNALTWDLSYVATKGGTQLEPQTTEVAMYVMHGASGIVTFLEEVPSDVTRVEVTGGKVKQMQSLWDTYLGWFVAGFIIIGISLLFFAIELFSRDMTRDDVKDLFREHATSTLVVMCFALIIAIFPIVFGSWVATLILVGTFIGCILGGGILSGIKAIFAK